MDLVLILKVSTDGVKVMLSITLHGVEELNSMFFEKDHYTHPVRPLNIDRDEQFVQLEVVAFGGFFGPSDNKGVVVAAPELGILAMFL